MLRAISILLGLAVAVVPRAQASGADWEQLRGLPILEVRILASEVFDPQHQEERHRIYSWANALHVRTRETVIRRELLFEVGDRFDPLLVGESERNLRNLGIFQDALIAAEHQSHGVLVQVRTADRWATKVVTDISHQGDILSLRLGLENINFIGRGTRLGGTVVTSNDIDAAQFAVREPRLLGSRWDVGYAYSSDELAIFNRASLRRPFFSELVRWSAQLDYQSLRGQRRIFEASDAVDSLDVDETRGEVLLALHGRAHTRSRWGLLFSRRSLTGDLHGEQASVALLWAVLRRDFRRMHDIDRFGTSEDVGSGWTLQLGAGADLRALGADHNRPLWRVDAAWARFLGDRSLFGVRLRHHGFERNGRLLNSRLLAGGYGFWQTVGQQTLAWSFGLASFTKEPAYLRFALGGDSRLRGYDARHANGTRALWLNLEDRLFTDLNLFFLRFGAVAFVDVAQAWDEGETPALRGTQVGGGFGLRIGNNKSGVGVTRLDFAFGRNTFEVSFASGTFFRAAHGLDYPSPRLFR